MTKTAANEMGFAALLLVAAMVLSWTFGLPFILPSLHSASFVGVHYLVPLLGLLAVISIAGMKGDTYRYVLIALPCYAFVLWLHFNIKNWAPFINPASYDAQFWAMDQQMRGVVDACFAIRQWLGTWVPGIDSLYMNGFMLMFYCSFIVHSMKTPDQFRILFLATILLQGLGGLAYLAMPAIGPFLYEQGANPVLVEAQAHMLSVHQAMIAGGTEWFEMNGAREFIAPLGAMPSLHAAGSFLFLWFSYKYCRALLPLYVPLFAFILMAAIANRFHYIVDLPVGIALAAASIWLAHRLSAPRVSREAHEPETAGAFDAPVMAMSGVAYPSVEKDLVADS